MLTIRTTVRMTTRQRTNTTTETNTRRGEGTSIWVMPSKHIVASNPDDKDMLFDPANDKIYRHPTFYIMPEGAKNI